jgi:hypothetical protein
VDPFFSLTVNYTMGGNATLGTNYTLSGPHGQVVIPAGQTSATVILSSNAASISSSKESAKLILAPGPGYAINKSHKSASVKLKKPPGPRRRNR